MVNVFVQVDGSDADDSDHGITTCAPLSPVSRHKFALQAESLDIKEDTEECNGMLPAPDRKQHFLIAMTHFRRRK